MHFKQLYPVSDQSMVKVESIYDFSKITKEIILYLIKLMWLNGGSTVIAYLIWKLYQ